MDRDKLTLLFIGLLVASRIFGQGASMSGGSAACATIGASGTAATVSACFTPINLVNNTYVQSSTSTGPATTSPVSCAGANFVDVMVADFGTLATGATVTSSPSNTFTAAANATLGSGTNIAHFRAWNASVSASMTFTVSNVANGGFPAILGQCFSGVLATADPLDQQSTGTLGAANNCQASDTLLSLGTVGELVVLGISNTNGEGYTISSGFDFTTFASSSTGTGGAVAWNVITSGQVMPTWTPSFSQPEVCDIISYKSQ